jgi:hypothetical protein
MGKLQNTEFPKRSTRAQLAASFSMSEVKAGEGLCIVGLLGSFSNKAIAFRRKASIRRLGNIHCFLQPDQEGSYQES